MTQENKLFINFSNTSNESIEKSIEQDVEIELDTKLGIYVCFDGWAKIYYEGDLPHCYMYEKMFHRHKGFHLRILSIERYNEMVETMKEYNWL